MKKLLQDMKKLLVILTVIMLVFQACSGKEDWDKDNENHGNKNQGSVALNLSQAGDFTTPGVKTTNVVDVKDFRVRIWQGETLYKSYAKYSDVPSTIEIDPGSYTIDAGTTDDKEAAFNQPIYMGQNDFSVQAGKVSSVNLVCTLTNMKITIKCSDKFFREINDDFEFVVRNNNNAFLVFTKKEIDNGTSGYFKVSAVTITLKGTKRLDNSEISHTVELGEGAAKDHHILNFDVQETGGVEIGKDGITVDYTVNNKDVEITIPGEDENPVNPPVDPVEPPVDPPADEYIPVITGNGIGTPLRLSDAQASEAAVQATVSTKNGKTIQSLIVEINSPYLTEEFLGGVGFPTRFDLANFTNDEAGQTLKGLIAELGLIDPDVPVKGLESYSFSIGAFMALIASNENGQDETHEFIITVLDSDGKSKTDTLTVIRYKGN